MNKDNNLQYIDSSDVELPEEKKVYGRNTSMEKFKLIIIIIRGFIGLIDIERNNMEIWGII